MISIALDTIRLTQAVGWRWRGSCLPSRVRLGWGVIVPQQQRLAPYLDARTAATRCAADTRTTPRAGKQKLSIYSINTRLEVRARSGREPNRMRHGIHIDSQILPPDILD